MGMRLAVWMTSTDVSEVAAASIIKAMIQAASTSETSATSSRLHVVKIEVAAICMMATVKPEMSLSEILQASFVCMYVCMYVLLQER
jgi:hypothetical protein